MTRHRPSRAKTGAPPLQPQLAAMRALAHPLRLRIVELFAETPRTTKQVATLLGQPPTRLYHHVKALDRAGLLRLTGTRRNRGTVEKWYEAVVPSFGASLSPRRAPGPEASATRRAIAMTVLEQSRQEVVAAMHQRRGERPLVGRLLLVASPKGVRRVRQRLQGIVKDIRQQTGKDDALPGPGDERWAITITFAPVSSASSP